MISMNRKSFLGSFLSLTTKIMIFMMIMIALISSTISSSADFDDTFGVFTKNHENEINDILLQEPTIRTIGKFSVENDIEQGQHTHLDNVIASKEVAVFQRMTQDNCVSDESALRLAVNNANPRNSSTPTMIDLCVKEIKTTFQISVIDKNIIFNCVLSNPLEKCTLDVQKKHRHFAIGNSKIVFKKIEFINGIASPDIGPEGGSLLISGSFNACKVCTDIEIINCDFFLNGASNIGGAIYIISSIGKIVNVTMRYNNANTVGGAIGIGISNISMINTIMTNNKADQGGAVNAGTSNVNLTNCILAENNATSNGGAIGSMRSNLVVANTIFSNNIAKFGGAIVVLSSTAIITHSTFSNNTVKVNGTGSWLYFGNSTATMADSVAYNNNPKNVCGLFQTTSRIRIDGKILLQNQSCLLPGLRSRQPSAMPSVSAIPSVSVKPSVKPSVSVMPSVNPSLKPSKVPSMMLSAKPSSMPSAEPLLMPQAEASLMPSAKPSLLPPKQPSQTPPVMSSAKPSLKSSQFPSFRPSAKPSTAPLMMPAAAPTNIGHNLCFSAMNTVEEKDHGVISITQVKIGDFVKTGTGKDYTQIYGFGHFDAHREAFFIQIHFDQEHDNSSQHVPNTLELTTEHLVFVHRKNQSYPIRASDVIVGDILSGKRVSSISSILRRGLYAPLTMSGDVAVSGIRASNYVDVLDYSGWYDQHVVGHAVFGPRRIFCSYFMNTCKQETYSNGYGPWSYIIVTVASKLNDLGWIANMAFSAWSVSVVHIVFFYEMQPILGIICTFLVVYVVLKRIAFVTNLK